MGALNCIPKDDSLEELLQGEKEGHSPGTGGEGLVSYEQVKQSTWFIDQEELIKNQEKQIKELTRDLEAQKEDITKATLTQENLNKQLEQTETCHKEALLEQQKQYEQKLKALQENESALEKKIDLEQSKLKQVQTFGIGLSGEFQKFQKGGQSSKKSVKWVQYTKSAKEQYGYISYATSQTAKNKDWKLISACDGWLATMDARLSEAEKKCLLVFTTAEKSSAKLVFLAESPQTRDQWLLAVQTSLKPVQEPVKASLKKPEVTKEAAE